MGVRADDLRTLPIEQNLGTGGPVFHARTEGELTFSGTDGAVVMHAVPLRLAVEPAAGAGVTSILGMDFLSAFRVVVSVQEGRVALEDLSG